MSEPKPLNILHLTGSSESGGLSRYLLDLSAGLRDRGHHVTIGGARGAWHDRFIESGIPWLDLPLRGGPIALWRAARILRDFLKTHPVDVVHTHYRRATLVARRAVKPGSPPILYTVHLSGIPMRGPWKWLSDFGDHTHAPSQGAVNWLINEADVPAHQITVIPHGIAIEKFPQRDAAKKAAAREKLGLSPTATIAAFVGRLDYPKNADWILDVAEAVPSCQIVLAGDGPDAPLIRQSIAEKNLDGRVKMLGECAVLPVYEAADALLLPSLREGFGLVCAEAMCVGVPVLRTQTSGTEELIVEGVTGRSVPIDRMMFVAVACEFLQNRDWLGMWGQAAAEHIRKNFTLDRQIDQTISLYREMQR